MKESYQLKDLGSALKDYITKNTSISLKDVAENALGIHKVSLYRRLGENNIKVEEAQLIADYAQIAVTVTLAGIPISNANQEATNYKELVRAQKEIIDLQKKVMELQEKLTECESKNAGNL